MNALLKYLFNYITTHRIQLSRFILVGLVTFCIYTFTFHVSYGLLQFDYKIATSIAYVITVLSHFLLHRTFTFSAMGQQVTHHIWRYVLMLALNYCITMFVMWTTVTIVEVSPYFGIVASTAITMVSNFIVLKYFVFSFKQATEG